MRKTPDKTCTDHCTPCGRHFHSLAAFDAHLIISDAGVEHVDPLTTTYAKGKYQGQPMVQVWTDEGYCKLGVAKQTLHPVTIYQSAIQGWANRAAVASHGES